MLPQVEFFTAQLPELVGSLRHEHIRSYEMEGDAEGLPTIKWHTAEELGFFVQPGLSSSISSMYLEYLNLKLT